MNTNANQITVSNNSRTVSKWITKTITIATLLIGFTACEEETDLGGPTDVIPNPASTIVFSMDKFEENLNNYVNANGNSPVGWAYTISKDGNLARSQAFGKARTSVDGALDFTLNKEINVASVTKFYTAIGVMQLLEANNLTIDAYIEPWLPASWTKGPGVNNLTFKDLLKHRSGLESTNNNFDTTLGYEGLKTCIATGVINPKNRNYLNVNFALFRVLIPSLWSAISNNAINIESDQNTQFMYLLYMQLHIFDRLDLPQVDCSPESRETATLYYNVNDPITNGEGRFYGSWNNKAGGGGYFMSVIEMAKVNAYFEHTEVLVTNEIRETMKQHRIGMSLLSNKEERGNYYGHGGSIGTSGLASQGVRTHIAMFPINGIDCVVVMNCQGTTFETGTSLQGMIYDAYNAAWVPADEI